ncbi:hypothetical protein SCHPADRAFT_897341 [Schizopora paradoxa]|uniref:Uncharacterized protein n=1 Tax=Schizopora paradoxa TaxID=27342 RepID=A0A0H2QYK0_9AGAM|nr:hypothetical protein SCHPADRAFT_897341 [Schizopora paradoxa]
MRAVKECEEHEYGAGAQVLVGQSQRREKLLAGSRYVASTEFEVGRDEGQRERLKANQVMKNSRAMGIRLMYNTRRRMSCARWLWVAENFSPRGTYAANASTAVCLDEVQWCTAKSAKSVCLLVASLQRIFMDGELLTSSSFEDAIAVDGQEK